MRRGAVIRLVKGAKDSWTITQLPEVEGAFVALDPRTGAVRALVGGFDYAKSKFNHVTQAWRQPGSSFKPFIYSAALEKGFTPSTVINDAPLFFDAGATGSQPWEPKNYDGKFEGPMTMRTALAKSKNMVSIRILQAIGPPYAQEWITRFGFDAEKHPAYLTMALGAGSVTPMQMATAYAVFANGGYRVNPVLIRRLTDDKGRVLARDGDRLRSTNRTRTIDARNAFVMTSLLQEVTRSGTAASAKVKLQRGDIFGKTGTTNDSMDAWFAGFQRSIVAVVWMGYDTPRKLGERETGGGLALAGLDRLHELRAAKRAGRRAERAGRRRQSGRRMVSSTNSRRVPASAASGSTTRCQRRRPRKRRTASSTSSSADARRASPTAQGGGNMRSGRAACSLAQATVHRRTRCPSRVSRHCPSTCLK